MSDGDYSPSQCDRQNILNRITEITNHVHQITPIVEAYRAQIENGTVFGNGHLDGLELNQSTMEVVVRMYRVLVALKAELNKLTERMVKLEEEELFLQELVKFEI